MHEVFTGFYKTKIDRCKTMDLAAADYNLLFFFFLHSVQTAQIRKHYAARCAVLSADTEIRTIRTFFIINNSTVVNNFDRTKRTYSFALFAADTAVCANLTGNSALILVAAGNNDLFSIGNK